MDNIRDIIRFEAMILRAELFPLSPIKQEVISPNFPKEDIWYHLKYNSKTKKIEVIYA